MMDFTNKTTNQEAPCRGFDGCVQGVIGGVAALILVSLFAAMLVTTIVLVVLKKRAGRDQCIRKKKTQQHELAKTGRNVRHGDPTAQGHDTYAREIETGLTSESHDYTSIDLTGNQVTTFSTNLEKGGRYIQLAKQDPKNQYNEVVVNTPVLPQISETEESHKYDVPKPQIKVAEQAENTRSGPSTAAQSDENPGGVVTPSNIKIKALFSRKHSNAASKRDGGKSKPSAAYENNVPLPLKTSRECIADTTSPSGQKMGDDKSRASTLTRPKGLSKAQNPMYRSVTEVGQRSPHEPPGYMNISKSKPESDAAAASGQTQHTSDSAHKATVSKDAVKPKPRVRMALKKPPLPSKMFKEGTELPEREEQESMAARKLTYSPNAAENKGVKKLPRIPRSKTVTWNSQGNVASLNVPQPSSNYTSIKVSEMDPNSDYMKL